MTTIYELVQKSKANYEHVNIKEIDGGIQVRRKKLKDNDVLPYVKTLLEIALKDIIELNEVEGIEKKYSQDELLDIFLTPQSGYIGVSCTNRDRLARIISILQEAIAIMNYIAGYEIV